MNRIIFFIAVLMFCFSSNIMATWDIWFNVPQFSEVTMQIVSLPFEGYNGTYYNLNRRDTTLGGTLHRRIVLDNQGNPVSIDSQMVYHHNPGLLASCFYEGGANGVNPVWGFGKYLIDIQIANQPDERYIFYWNSLDSKMGTDDYQGRDYYVDWYFIYNASLPAQHRMVIHSSGGVDYDTLYAYTLNPVIEEIKIWKLLYPTKPNIEEPWERKFYARTTPFGVSPTVIEKYNLKHFILGTTVILDGVYSNNGYLDKFGYNTFLGPIPYNYWQDPPIEQGQNLTSYTYSTPGGWYKDLYEPIYGFKLTAVQNDTLILKSNMRLWISGFYEELFSGQRLGDTIIFSPGSTLKKESNAQINTYLGGCLIDSGANAVWASGSFHKAYVHSSLEYYGNLEHTVNNGGHIEINGNATLKLGDNTVLTFDGSGTYLKLNPNSQVILGNNAQIRFTNGAYLDARGATFTCTNGYWQGIVFENVSQYNYIYNCTFSKAITAMSFYNDLQHSFYGRCIRKNTFNIENSHQGIYAQNVFNTAFDSNHFNMTSGCIGARIQNSIEPGEEGSGGDYPPCVRFAYNDFTGGYIQLMIGSYASTSTPVYVYGNAFNNNSGGWCFVGRLIAGDVQYNNMTSNSQYHTFGLWQSNVKMFGNLIKNTNKNAITLNTSFPYMGPMRNPDGSFVWIGGYNDIQSTGGDNLQLASSYPFIDWGRNDFTIGSSSLYHLYGSMPDTTSNNYYGRNNCWYGNGTLPRYYLYKSGYQNITLVYQNQNYNCNHSFSPISYQVYDIGESYYDTVYVTTNDIGTIPPDDEALYSQAMIHVDEAEYYEAVGNFKNLVDNYGASSYLCPSLYEIYGCYEALDTSDQNHRDLIFGDLKFYLENKIEQYPDNDDFISIAYNLILMCETKIQNYNEAMTGYEFISLYHPDPEQRLLASMDYGEIQNYLNGMGGGESSNPKLTKRSNVLKLMDKKPYSRIVKNIFIKASRELDKKLNDKNLREDNQVIQKKELIERARQNINVSRSFTKEQREERRMEDIRLLIKQTDNSIADNTINIPSRYILHQNYPNPFNPTTTIKYELPNDGVIKFKIYDILGKEIYSVNEFKKAGIHTIMFDGSKYASGIYFYRLESGSYAETKKMVLVK